MALTQVMEAVKEKYPNLQLPCVNFYTLIYDTLLNSCENFKIRRIKQEGQ